MAFPFFRRQGASREPPEPPQTAWVIAERALELGDEVEALLGGRSSSISPLGVSLCPPGRC